MQVFGQQKYAVRVQVDPNELAARGIGINEVQQAVSQANVNLPTGTLYGKQRLFAVQANGQLFDAAAFRPVIVAYRNGSPIRLDELGRVIDSVQTDKVAAWYKGKRGIVLAIHRQPGTNTVEVVDAVKKLMPTFRAEVPAGIGVEVLYDRTVVIRAVGRRGAIRAAARARPGRDGDLPVPAEHPCDPDSERRAADVTSLAPSP